jgi:hypothetical protein
MLTAIGRDFGGVDLNIRRDMTAPELIIQDVILMP